MEMNTRIQAMLNPGSAPNAGPAAGGAVAPSINAIATNGKLLIESVSKLAETLETVFEELNT